MDPTKKVDINNPYKLHPLLLVVQLSLKHTKTMAQALDAKGVISNTKRSFQTASSGADYSKGFFGRINWYMAEKIASPLSKND